MPLFRSRPLPPKEDTITTKPSKGIIEDDWLDPSKPHRKGERKSQRKTIVRNNPDDADDNPIVEDIEQASCSSLKRKKEQTDDTSEERITAVPSPVTLSSGSDDVSYSPQIVADSHPIDVSDQDTTPVSPVDEPQEIVNTSVTTQEAPNDQHDASPFDHSIRIRYNGEIKRITFDKNKSLNKQLNVIHSAFNIPTNDQQIFTLLFEKTDARLDMDVEPILLPEGLNIVVDVFRLIPVSKDLLESERAALAEFDLSASENTSNAPKKPVDEYALNDGRFRIKVRLTIQVPHGSCLVCKSNCAICSKSASYLDTSKMSKKRDTLFKTKISSSDCKLSELFSLVKKHIGENYVIGGDGNCNLDWIIAKYEFDAEEVGENSKPKDLDMEDESLVEARLKDSRCAKKECNCNETTTSPTVNTAAGAKRGGISQASRVLPTRGTRRPRNNAQSNESSTSSEAADQQQMMTVVDLE